MSYNLQLQGSAVRLLVDIVLLAILLIFTENFKRLWWPSTTQRGFFCDDQSLMHPYHENTVSSTLVHWLGVHGPLIAITLLEIHLLCWQRAKSQWQEYFNLYNSVRWFLYGYGLSEMIKNIGKETIGRLRPHFFKVCMPLLADGGTCLDEAHSSERGGVYHMEYTCQPDISGATEDMLTDLHVSFPSGHSSMAFYGLVFLALHLQRRRWPLRGSLLSPILQLVCYGVAWFVGMSRVMDYKHHWSDVAAGSLLGAGVAFVVIQAAKLEERQTKGAHLNGKENEEGQQQQSPSTATSTAAGGGGGGLKTEQLPPHDLRLVTCCGAN